MSKVRYIGSADFSTIVVPAGEMVVGVDSQTGKFSRKDENGIISIEVGVGVLRSFKSALPDYLTEDDSGVYTIRESYDTFEDVPVVGGKGVKLSYLKDSETREFVPIIHGNSYNAEINVHKIDSVNKLSQNVLQSSIQSNDDYVPALGTYNVGTGFSDNNILTGFVDQFGSLVVVTKQRYEYRNSGKIGFVHILDVNGNLIDVPAEPSGQVGSMEATAAFRDGDDLYIAYRDDNLDTVSINKHTVSSGLWTRVTDFSGYDAGSPNSTVYPQYITKTESERIGIVIQKSVGFPPTQTDTVQLLTEETNGTFTVHTSAQEVGKSGVRSIIENDGKMMFVYPGNTTFEAHTLGNINVSPTDSFNFSADTIGSGGGGATWKLAKFSNGDILIYTDGGGGAFDRCMAKYNTAFVKDATFEANIGTDFATPNARILVLPNDKILASSAVTGNLRRLNADGSVDNTFNTLTYISSASSVLRLLDESDPVNSIIYTLDNGIPKLLNPDGTVNQTFPSTSPSFTPIVIDTDTSGRYYCLGFGASYNGVTYNGVIRLLANGDNDTISDFVTVEEQFFKTSTNYGNPPEVGVYVPELVTDNEFLWLRVSDIGEAAPRNIVVKMEITEGVGGISSGSASS